MTITLTKGEREPIPDPDPRDPDRYADIALVPDDDIEPDEGEMDYDGDGEPDGYAGELVPFDERIRDPWSPSPMRAPLERFANRQLPTLHTVKSSTTWWARHLSRASLQLLIHSPELTLYQIPHVFRGLGKWATAYAAWRAKPDWMKAAKEYEPHKRADKIASVERHKRNATRLTWFLGVVLLVGLIIAIRLGHGTAVLAAVIIAVIIAALVGRKGAPVSASTIEIMPRSAFREGMPSGMVIEDVKAVLATQGHDPETTAVVEPRVGEYGLALQLHSQRELAEADVAAIERGLQTYRGAVNVIADPTNAAVSEIRIWWTDPLAVSMTPERLAPKSGSIGEPAVLGYGVGGVPLQLIFMRTNLGIVGSPGSGKSSTLWTCIDWLSSRHDVILHGIDLSGGPALRAWGDVFTSRAFNVDDAKALLQERIRSSIARTHLLAERSEPRPGMPAPESENWTPKDAAEGRGKFHILVVDELPLMASDKELIALYTEHQRIGRKAGETSIWAAQDLAGDTIGLTSIRKHPSTLILHACSREDVTSALGGGKIKEGWTPHRLVPAQGDQINDAGKCFITGGGGHNRPIPWRMGRLDDLAEIHSRAMERIEAGMPTDEADAQRTATDVAEIPAVLAVLASIFRAAGQPEFMPTSTLLERLQELSDEAYTEITLAAAVKPYGIRSGRQRHGGTPTRGYAWADVNGAIEAL